MGNMAKMFVKSEGFKVVDRNERLIASTNVSTFKPSCKAMCGKKMNCTPKCTYFPNMECKDFVYDETLGYKRRVRPDGSPIEFVCGYDGHVIKSWYDECPLEIDKIKMLKEKQHGKPKRL